jgi:TolA-binding protein
MNHYRWLGALALSYGVAVAPAHSQEPLKPFRSDDGKPVMRAIPVRPPKPIPEDAEERPPADLPVATPIPMPPKPGVRATPFRLKPITADGSIAPDDPQLEEATRKPRMTKPPEKPPVAPAPAVTVAPEKASPPPKATAVPPSPEPADPGEIRISPQGSGMTQDQAQMALADSYYAKKMYEMAAPEYQRYLDTYVGRTMDRQAALFRLAECYRQQGANNNARMAYDTLLAQYQQGDFVGPASYRLAELYYQAKEYSSALPLYRKASVRVKEPAVANAAKFFTARSLEALGQKLDARLAYEELAAATGDNPFADASRLSLALLLKDAGRTTDALKQIQALAKQTENAELKAEATVRTGVWQLELKQPAKAAEEFRKALEMPGIGRWKEVAQLGLLRYLYDSEKYKELLSSYDSQAAEFSAETKAEVLILVANANRQIGKLDVAQQLYDQVIKEFPTSNFSKDAAYERLVLLYNAENDQLVPEIDAFLATNPDPNRRDQVTLMKAESLFKKQDHPTAAALYSQVSKSRLLPGTLRAEALFKLGWCSMQIRDYDRAIQAFTELMDTYPTNKSVPYALVQRAIAYQSQKKLAEAERDFTDLIRKWPKSKERELALQQKALIRGQLNDNAGMAENFKLLLKDYPESAASAQAHYWVGWAAYEAKNYKEAAQQLDLARKKDAEQFFERASLRVMLSYYYLEDVQATAREADYYKTEGKGKGKVPTDVVRWLGEKLVEQNSAPEAVKYLAELASREEAAPKDWLTLGQAQLAASQFPEAVKTFESYLTKVKEAPSRALGFLDLAKAQLGAKEFGPAQKSVDEALTLQPEGKTSGEARIIAGDIHAARGEWEQAAKLYESVAVIIDDEEITPRALEKAVGAHQKNGNEEQAKKTLNRLQSRYPEYAQRKRIAL